MKSISIVTDGRNKLDSFLKKNLLEIFQGYVKVNAYQLNDLKKGDKISGDIVLVMIREKVIEVEEFVDNNKKIIIIERTIRSKEAYKVFSIPEGMEVLVVNDNYRTALQTVSLLYEIGINHLKLIPYDSKKKYEDIKIAITPGEKMFVPDGVDKVIDLGNRIIDISTFYKIISILEMKDKEILERIIRYSDELINKHSGIDKDLKELVIKKDAMDTLVNLSKDAIIHTTNDGKITTFNEKFMEIFSLDEMAVSGRHIEDIFPEEYREVLERDLIEDEVFNIGSKYLNVNKKVLNYMGRETGAYFYIQEITYIRKLEQNLSKKLRQKGQIARYHIEDIITESERMIKCKNFAEKIAKTELTVLITGESGTGKELMAQSIHNASNREKQAFIAINCAAMPDNLLESELFGYEAGAFTGANKEGKRGLFEQANYGTIFLDEIGDMPLHLQTKLLRVLQERQVMRVGGEQVMDVDVRVIAATNKDLLKLIDEEKFRADLYYRINVLPIRIPSLRERTGDIILLLRKFMKRSLEFDSEVESILKKYPWKGNIRELKNVAAYIDTLCENTVVNMDDLPDYLVQLEEMDFTQEIKIIREKKCMELSLHVLKELSDRKKSGRGLGRSKMIQIFQEKCISCTENDIKKVLNVLDEEGLVKSSIGRGGSRITDKGVYFVNHFDVVNKK